MSEQAAAGSLTWADLGKHADVTVDQGYVVAGTLVATGHNARLGQSYVGVGSGRHGRGTRGIHVDPTKIVALTPANAVSERKSPTTEGAGA